MFSSVPLSVQLQATALARQAWKDVRGDELENNPSSRMGREQEVSETFADRQPPHGDPASDPGARTNHTNLPPAQADEVAADENRPIPPSN